MEIDALRYLTVPADAGNFSGRLLAAESDGRIQC